MVPRLIDTHAHLDDRRFAGDIDRVLERAALAGLVRIQCIATTADSAQTGLDLAANNALLAPSVGIHPNHVAEAGPGDWDRILQMVAEHPEIIALGETGLDRHWDHTPFEQQRDFFARHLQLMRQTGLPVVIHCREAEADLVPMLREEFDARGPLVGVIHSFCGDQAMAEACLAMGLYLSFAGMLTYKNAADLRAVAATVPHDRMLVETDCPYLTPVPHRGQRNEPAYVAHTAECLAQVHGLTLAEVGNLTTANAERLFRPRGAS